MLTRVLTRTVLKRGVASNLLKIGARGTVLPKFNVQQTMKFSTPTTDTPVPPQPEVSQNKQKSEQKPNKSRRGLILLGIIGAAGITWVLVRNDDVYDDGAKGPKKPRVVILGKIF
jgi:hypothetical protein